MQTQPEPSQQPQMDPNSLQVGPGGYLPPAQFGDAQDGCNPNEEKQLLQDQVAEFERSLTTGYLKYFQWWLLGVAGLSTLGAIAFSTAFPKGFQSIAQIVFIALFFIFLWNAAQNGFGMKALIDRNLKFMKITCWSTIIFWAPNVLLEMFIAMGVFYTGGRDRPEELQHLLWIPVMIMALHSGSMVGALKVKKILEEKESAEMRLAAFENSYSVQV